MKLLQKLKTAHSFSGKQWRMLIEAYLLLIAARARLLLLPTSYVEKALAQETFKASAGISSQPPKELMRLFGIAWRHQWPRASCLPTALAQQAFLARYGYPTQLRIGVKKEGNHLLAHAWCGQVTTSSDGFEPIP